MYTKLLVVFSIILFTACSQLEPQCPPLQIQGLEVMKPIEQHRVLAEKYGELYTLYISKVAIQKANLSDYEEKHQYYGRNGLDFEGHAKANLDYYQTLADKAMKEATYHKEMVQKLEQ